MPIHIRRSAARSLPQKILVERIGIPPPPCSAAAAPAASVSMAAVWLRVLLGPLPLPLRSGLRRLRGAAAARCWSVSGLLRRRCPVRRRALAGEGVSRLGSLRCAARLNLGADYAPSGLVLLAGCALLPYLPWAQKCARCLGCCGLPLRPAPSGRTPSCAFVLRCCPARCRRQPLRGIDTTKLHTCITQPRCQTAPKRT